MATRVAFLGNDPWSVPPLEALAAEPELELVLVGTNPPRPAGRGDELTPTAVALLARERSFPLVEVDGVGKGAGLEALHDAAPDVLVVVAYGEILSREVLDLAPLGAVNLHFSLLPRWRGAAPVQHALMAGDELTGVTVMRMDEGLDTGPILGSLEEPIRPDDDAGSLGARLAHLGGILLVGTVRQLAEQGLTARSQDGSKATFAGKLGPADRALDWTQEPGAIVRRVRALSPDPAATTRFRDGSLKVFAAAVGHDEIGGAVAPGTIVAADDRGVAVAAGGGTVRLLEVAPSGRRRMPAAAWARGARFADGEHFG
jgi:methionyl-tRNA formyltransferase